MYRTEAAAENGSIFDGLTTVQMAVFIIDFISTGEVVSACARAGAHLPGGVRISTSTAPSTVLDGPPPS